MFRIIFFITYLPLLIYVYQRGSAFFEKNWAKKTFKTILVFLSLAFPVFDFWAHQTTDSHLDFLIQLGFYTQPYLLYLFLCFIFLEIGRLFYKKIIHNKAVITFIFIFPLFVVIWGAYRFNDIKINRYEIEIPKRDSQLEKLRIIFASDMHLRGKAELKSLKQFITFCQDLKPDLVLLPGDILEGDHHETELSLLENEFLKLNPRFGVYATLGNHETYGKKLEVDFFKRANITLLRDAFLTFENNFTIIGRDDMRFKTRKSFEEIHKLLPQHLPLFLMDHRPTDFEKVQRDHIDLQVSGHTHHGQLFPFNTITQMMYDLSWGHKKQGATHFFVSSGLRGWGPQVRTTGDAELVVIDVNFK